MIWGGEVGKQRINGDVGGEAVAMLWGKGIDVQQKPMCAVTIDTGLLDMKF